MQWLCHDAGVQFKTFDAMEKKILGLDKPLTPQNTPSPPSSKQTNICPCAEPTELADECVSCSAAIGTQAFCVSFVCGFKEAESFPYVFLS